MTLASADPAFIVSENVIRVLLVIEDPAEFERTSTLFGDVASACDVKCGRNEIEALYCLSSQRFDAIFVDLTAGALESARFLSSIAEIYPQMTRVVIGASLESDILVSCLVASHQFLLRAISSEDVQEMIDRIRAVNNFLNQERLRNLIARIRTFPAQPTVYFEIIRELRSESCSVETVGKLIEKDSFVLTKFLQLINSASFGLSNQITSSADAVLLLGLDTTAAVILGIETLGAAKSSRVRLDVASLWRHSQSVSELARHITVKITGSATLSNSAFTAGLLHDIGKIALAMNVGDDYTMAVKISGELNRPTHELEREILGATHAEVGAYLLGMWGLPLPILYAVAGHHSPKAAVPPAFSEIAAVHLANMLLEKNGAPSLDQAIEGYPQELNLAQLPENLTETVSSFAHPL